MEVWILKDLHDSGLRGNLPMFIENFLKDRIFNVRLGSTLSETYMQEMGVPQGSILSPTLFNLKINSIVNCLSHDIDPSLYVDDFLISYKSKNLNSIEIKLQLCMRKLEKSGVMKMALNFPHKKPPACISRSRGKFTPSQNYI